MCKSLKEHESIIPNNPFVSIDVQVRRFRASKKTSNSGEPASPNADRCKSIERIKTDYNSYLYTLCRLIVLYINNLYEIVRLARGMVSSLKNIKEDNK